LTSEVGSGVRLGAGVSVGVGIGVLVLITGVWVGGGRLGVAEVAQPLSAAISVAKATIFFITNIRHHF